MSEGRSTLTWVFPSTSVRLPPTRHLENRWSFLHPHFSPGRPSGEGGRSLRGNLFLRRASSATRTRLTSPLVVGHGPPKDRASHSPVLPPGSGRRRVRLSTVEVRGTGGSRRAKGLIRGTGFCIHFPRRSIALPSQQRPLPVSPPSTPDRSGGRTSSVDRRIGRTWSDTSPMSLLTSP